MTWVIYQRDDCHLCDQALDVLAQARVPALTSVFIDDDADLEARYGVRVPVLAAPDGRELNWPFGVEAVGRMLLAVAASPAEGPQEAGSLPGAE